MDIAAFSLPGNRYGPLNQDYAVVQEFYAPGEVSGGQQQVYAAIVCDGHGVLGDVAARISGKSCTRHLYSSATLRSRPLAQVKEAMTKDMHDAFLRGHKAALSLYDDAPKNIRYPTPSGSGMDTYSLTTTSSGLPVYRSSNKHLTERLLEFGCTCTCALLQGSTVCVANVGDSTAVLGSDTGSSYAARTLTAHHNGRHPEEAVRVMQASSKVKLGMDGYLQVVEGPWLGYQLAVTRALGHKHMAEYGVIPDPYIACFDTKPEDCCMIIASDGVWDVIDGQEAVNRVMEAAGEGKTAAQIAKLLVQDAVELGLASPSAEADNTSAIVVLFE